MNYIRTKDGRIAEVKKNMVIKNGIRLVYKDRPHICVLTGDDDIIKQANTVKDLCDAYVITSKQGHIYDTYGNYDYELTKVLPQAREEYPDEDWDLYGCILVDGMIKQVAKFNDENGELELL